MVFLSPLLAFASFTTDFYRSRASGNFNTVAVWESSSNNLNWVLADKFPGSQARGITIRSGHTLSILSRTDLDDLIIEEGAQLNVASGVDFTILNGVAATDALVNGLIINQGNFFVQGSLIFGATGIYRHASNANPNRFPLATWQDGSIAEITGISTFSSTIQNINQNYYDFTWNCSSQLITSNPSIGLTNMTVRNNFSILSTGQGSITFSGSSFNLNVSNFSQSGGTITVNPLSNSGLICNIFISGSFVQTGGILSKGVGTAIGNIIFNGNNTQNFNKTGGTINQAVNFIVNSGSTLDFGSSILNGTTGTFTAQGGSTLITANPQGFAATGATGSIQNTGARTFSTGANYTYNGSTAQQTGTGLPASVNNLTIDNPAGVSMRSGALAVNGTLAIPNGFLDMGTNALTVAAANGFTGTGTLRTQNTSANPISAGKNWLGTVEFNAGTNQTIVSGTFNNLTASTGGTKTVSGAASVSNTLTVNSPAVLNANGNLTLMATANSNANLAALSGSADVTGDVNVQVYLYGVPSGRTRGTKTMSSPINDNLIAGAKTFAQLKNYIPITGPGNTANGFDLGGAVDLNAVTLNFYNEPAAPTVSAFTPVPTLATAVSPGTGFLTFFRGNRDNMYTNPGKLNAPFPPAEDVLLTFTGPINKGNIDVPIGFTNFSHSTDGYYVAGNPYPATIDWHEVRNASSNLSSTILIVTGGKPNATYNAVGNVSVNGGSRYIQPGQGFYVQALSGGGTLRFRENQKNTTEAPARLLSQPNEIVYTDFGNFKLPSSTQNLSKQLRFSLSSAEFSEEALVVFDDAFTKHVDEYDSKYLEGYNINLATLSPKHELLAINSTSRVDTLNLWVNAEESSKMTLKFGNLDAFAKQDIILWDKLLNKRLAIHSGYNYAFTIDKTNPASYGADRLALLFKDAGSLAEAVKTIKVFPNPVKEELSVDLGAHPALEISVLDLNGRTIKNLTFVENQEIKVNVSDLNNALYILQIKNRDTKEVISHVKFVKN